MDEEGHDREYENVLFLVRAQQYGRTVAGIVSSDINRWCNYDEDHHHRRAAENPALCDRFIY